MRPRAHFFLASAQAIRAREALKSDVEQGGLRYEQPHHARWRMHTQRLDPLQRHKLRTPLRKRAILRTELDSGGYARVKPLGGSVHGLSEL